METVVQNPEERTSMVVAERGSNWTPWVERFRAHTTDVEVMVQEKGETLAEFAARVRSRLQRNTEGAAVARAVLVGGGRQDADALTARSHIIRAIAAEMATTGGGDVMLDDAGQDRFSMAALAATISMLIHGTGVDVRHVGTRGLPQAA